MRKPFLLAIIIILCYKTEAQTSVFKDIDSLLMIGNYQKALMILEGSDDKTVAVYDKTGDIYKSIGNYSKAIKNYQQALEKNKSIAIKTKLGSVYELSGYPSKAIKAYENVMQKDSSNLIMINNLGKLYLSNYKATKAEYVFKYLIEQDSLNPNYPYLLAKSYEKQSLFFAMGQSYLDAYNIDSLHIKSIYRLAVFFNDLKDKDSTMVFIDKGLQLAPDNINFNQLKANQLYGDKDYKSTLDYLDNLERQNYKSVNVYEMFGMSYLKLDSLDLAKEYFNKALNINRNNSKILYRLATVEYDLGETKKAKNSLLFSIYTAKPDLDKQYYLLGVIHKEENNLKEAIYYFEKSFQNNPKRYTALYELAISEEMYYKDKKIALKNYQKFIDMFKSKDKVYTDFVSERINQLKETLFLDGEKIE
ncbi:MAG: hypothetical protein PSN34_11960 [Urechidicola sp.]|nr:hypothetical protein [Urechidicola sp.]